MMLISIGIITLLLLHWVFTTPSPSASTNSVHPLEEQIQALRMGDLVIRVVDPAGAPVPEVRVHVTQTRHDFPFGVSLRTEMFQDGVEEGDRTQYLNTVKRLFNATVPEDALKWYSTEPVRGQVSYADADQILNWSDQHHFPMRGHHLFWAVDQWNQDWLKELQPEALRTIAQERATTICSRYRGRISEYDVLNEILNGDFFQSRLGADIVKQMFVWCQRADPSARLYTNEYNILNGEQLDEYCNLVRSLLQQQVPLGGIGVQAHLRQTISPAEMQRALDALAEFGLPIKITEVSVVADTDEQQATQLADLYRVAFAHPAVNGITLWGFWEGSNWEPRSALFRQNWEPKLAALTYQDLILQQWWTDESGTTDDQGQFTVPAFLGDYQIVIEGQTETITETSSIHPDEPHAEIIITLG